MDNKLPLLLCQFIVFPYFQSNCVRCTVQMGVVDPIIYYRIRVWNLQPDLRGIHHKNQRHVNIDDDNFGNSVEGELEVPLKEMACVVMQHVAVAPKISITIGLQLFFWE